MQTTFLEYLRSYNVATLLIFLVYYHEQFYENKYDTILSSKDGGNLFICFVKREERLSATSGRSRGLAGQVDAAFSRWGLETGTYGLLVGFSRPLASVFLPVHEKRG